MAIADKDALARNFIGIADTQISEDFSRPANPSFGIPVAETCPDGLLPAAGMILLSNSKPFPNSAGYPLYHPWNCDTGGVSLQEEQFMQAALMEQPSTQSCERYDLSMLARQHLEHHPHFRGRVSDVFIEHRGRTLVLTGKLPTFYLKQLVQEAVRHVPGVQHVRNMIDVVSANGISSVRC